MYYVLDRIGWPTCNRCVPGRCCFCPTMSWSQHLNVVHPGGRNEPAPFCTSTNQHCTKRRIRVGLVNMNVTHYLNNIQYMSTIFNWLDHVSIVIRLYWPIYEPLASCLSPLSPSLQRFNGPDTAQQGFVGIWYLFVGDYLNQSPHLWVKFHQWTRWMCWTRKTDYTCMFLKYIALNLREIKLILARLPVVIIVRLLFPEDTQWMDVRFLIKWTQCIVLTERGR